MPNILALCHVDSGKKIFEVLFYICLCKIREAPGWGQYWPEGHDLSNLGRGPLDNATCQISKLYVLWFQRRRFLKFFQLVAMATRVLHGSTLFEQFLNPPMPGTSRQNFINFGLTVSEEMSFESVNGRRTDDGRWVITITHLEHFVLRWAKMPRLHCVPMSKSTILGI